jgi:hypothetical protein
MEEQISLLRRIDERQAAGGMDCILAKKLDAKFFDTLRPVPATNAWGFCYEQ